MAQQLRVDLDRLESTAQGLSCLIEAFKQARSQAESARDVIGNDRLADAVEEFGKNWNFHAQKLEEMLEKVRDMAQNSAVAIHDVDGELAKSLINRPQSTHVTS